MKGMVKDNLLLIGYLCLTGINFGIQKGISNENNLWKSKIIAKYTKNGTLVDNLEVTIPR